MKVDQTIQKPIPKTNRKVVVKDIKETEYSVLSKEDALSMTAEVIEKYRPALEKLAE
jgi:hypothetical protein